MSEEFTLTKKENAFPPVAQVLHEWVAETDTADTPPAWSKLKRKVAQLIAGTLELDQNLAQSLRKFATGQLDESTAGIISAIVLYALECAVPNRRADHLRLAIDLLRTAPACFVDIQGVIDAVPIKELRECFENIKMGKEQRERDLGRLCYISIGRLDSDTRSRRSKTVAEEPV